MRICGDYKMPITQDDVARKRASLHVGDIIKLPIKQYDLSGLYIGIRQEDCEVTVIGRHVVMFRRMNGSLVSRTLVDLCQMDRER